MGKEVFVMATKEMTVKLKREFEKGAAEATRPGPAFIPAGAIFETEQRHAWVKRRKNYR